MSDLRLRFHPDPILREVCAPVADFGEGLQDLAQAMLKVMYDAPGRGLAGPQIGLTQRIFVMDATWKDGDPAPLICINPVVDWASEDTVPGQEGCLSIPDTPCLVRRPKAIRLRWQDAKGTGHEAAMDGTTARIALHELDHLDGILCIDRHEGATA